MAFGPIDEAIWEICRTGFSPLRIAKTLIPNVAIMNSGLTQITSKANSRKIDSISAADPSALATEIHIGPAAVGSSILSPL